MSSFAKAMACFLAMSLIVPSVVFSYRDRNGHYQNDGNRGGYQNHPGWIERSSSSYSKPDELTITIINTTTESTKPTKGSVQSYKCIDGEGRVSFLDTPCSKSGYSEYVKPDTAEVDKQKPTPDTKYSTVLPKQPVAAQEPEPQGTYYDVKKELGETPKNIIPVSGRSGRITKYFRMANDNVGTLECNQKIHERNVSPQTKSTVIMRDGNRCMICGGPSQLEIDHMRALENGGDNSLGNLAVLCNDCLSMKSKYDRSLTVRRDIACGG